MIKVETLIIGSGAAGLAAAVRLDALGRKPVIYTEGLSGGTSLNTGSDKQTYYKLSMDGSSPDSPCLMAADMAAGGAVHGDIALVEASLSPIAFSYLVSLGVAFPHDAYGRFVGYQTDHSDRKRATSAGPYTSRDMCLALTREVFRRGIEVVEDRVAVELLVRDGTVVGAVFADTSSDLPSFEAVVADNVVFATGGPGGLYGRSVYPGCHTGAIGVALMAGAEARNLAESQFGMASVKFRWNVSGSYMQVIPRIYSVDADGVERDFVTDFFGSPSAAANAIFLKGYQWPFSAGNVRGSSLIDILVYIETVEKGRRVYLDYRDARFTSAELLASLSPEAREYLEKSQAVADTPFARLSAMNPKAIALYRDHGIDLETEPLEIAVCAQHNNGGLAGDIWWQSTNLRHLFPIGEVNGSHGVTRPGGTALNAGQVGAWRAAGYIARGYANPLAGEGATAELAAAAEARYLALCAEPAHFDWRTTRTAIEERMDRAGGFIREEEAVSAAIREAQAVLPGLLVDGLRGLDGRAAAESLRTRQLAFAQLIYLQAIREQMRLSGSRGGSVVLCGDGEEISPRLDAKWRMKPENLDARGEITVCRPASDGTCSFAVEPCRPVPTEVGWFERVWAEYTAASQKSGFCGI